MATHGETIVLEYGDNENETINAKELTPKAIALRSGEKLFTNLTTTTASRSTTL